MEEQIKDIILGYCEGKAHPEFSIDDLPKMASEIAELLELDEDVLHDIILTFIIVILPLPFN